MSKGRQNIIDNLNKAFGEGSVGKMKDLKKIEVERFSSRSMKVDDALGGGYPYGRIIEIIGPESSGKTTLALHAVAEIQALGQEAAFIDAEHAFDPEYARNLGIDTDELTFSQPDNGEEALEIVDALIKTGDFSLIVIDSVAALIPKSELEGEMGDASVGKQAKMMAQAMRKLVGIAKNHECTLIFINQIRMKIGVMFGSPETTPGGNALKFAASQRIDVRRTGSNKQGEEVVSNKIKVKVIKNKVAPPFKIAETEIAFGRGILLNAEILDVAIDLKIVKQSGSHFSYGDVKLGQGRQNVLELMDDNEEMVDEIKKEIVIVKNGYQTT